MIIDRNAGVTPNRFESPWLRRTIGKRIGRASRDDMLGALLWVSEVRLAGDVAEAWRELHEELDREITEAQRRRDRLSWQLSDQVAAGCQQAAKELTEGLWGERREAEEALKQCEDIVQEFSRRLGINLQDDPHPDTRAALAVLNDQLLPVRQRLAELMSHDRQELHRLANLEARKRQGVSPQHVTIEWLDAAEQHEFDHAVQQALQHSGFQAVSPEPRVLEVSRGDAVGLVFCANVQRPGRDEATDVRMLLTALRLAEVGGYPGVLLVSNLRYLSRPAYRLFQETTSSVQLVQRSELQRWIEWEVPLRNVLVAA